MSEQTELSEARVRELREQAYNGYVDDWTGDTHDEIAAICDFYLRSNAPEVDSVRVPRHVFSRVVRDLESADCSGTAALLRALHDGDKR